MDYARVLHQVRHKNLVRLLGVCSSMEPVYFVMEYMPNGSLLDFLRQDSGQLVKLPVIVKMAAQISDGMAYLEAKTIPHLDLRAANVLLGQHYDVKRPTFEYLHSFFGDYNVSTEEKYRQIETEAT
nr:hypothetical protein BaRGS_031160 [Batillaria attramentaria]